MDRKCRFSSTGIKDDSTMFGLLRSGIVRDVVGSGGCDDDTPCFDLELCSSFLMGVVAVAVASPTIERSFSAESKSSLRGNSAGLA